MTTEGGDLRDRDDETRVRLPSWREDTYATRLARLRRRRNEVVAVGAGLTGFVVAVAAGAVAAGIYSDVPSWVRATIFTLVVAAGAGLGLAWIRFEEETDRIARAIDFNADLAVETHSRPAPTPR